MTRRSGSNTLYNIDGNIIAADTVVSGIHLQIYNSNGTLIAEMPLTQLQRDYNSPEPYRVAWKDIETTQCKIYIKTSATGYNANHFVELIWELECDQCGIVTD